MVTSMQFNASCASRLRVVWRPPSLVFLLPPVSASRPDRSSTTRSASSCAARSSSTPSFFDSSRSVCNKLLGHDVTASSPSTTFPPSLPNELCFFALAPLAVLPATAALLFLTLAVPWCTLVLCCQCFLTFRGRASDIALDFASNFAMAPGFPCSLRTP